jgi:predicted GNAT superfamily acetyltransferase
MAVLNNLLALNNAHQTETGFLEIEELTSMMAKAFYCEYSGEGGDALLITFDQDANYASPNFLWFKSRYDRFVYVDRIIVALHARGQGLARQYYETLFARAAAAGHSRVTCEVNLDPPNPGSLAFHAALGFVPCGETLLGNGKTVRYLERLL